jgi:hypothetical protein
MIGNLIRQTAAKRLLAAVLFIIGVSYLPYLICSRQADSWYAGELERQQALGSGVEKWVEKNLSLNDFHTGSAQFNGEWLFGTYTMAAMGYGQTAIEHPELRKKYTALMEQCFDKLLSDQVRLFDCAMWGNDPIESLESLKNHHAAYLGYFNLSLSLHRMLVKESKYAELNDRITAALIRRIKESRFGLLQSYPGEVYAVDNCAVIGSIALHARATGKDYGFSVSDWLSNFKRMCVDSDSGLLIQAANFNSGEPADLPRGSGTALGIYLVSFADYDFAKELYAAAKSELAKNICGFGGVREYTSGTSDGYGDIDSGPVVFGYGLSATGFMIGGARLCRDKAYYARLYATAYAWGAPYENDGKLNFVTGASLGDAILFAMLTAPKGGLKK